MAGRYAAALSREPLFSVEFSPEDIERLRIRALLHDIGHYPFAHYFEEFGGALPGLRFSHTLFGERILRGKLACQERAGGHTPLRSVIDPDEFLAPAGGKSGRSLLDAIVDGPVDCDKLDYLIRDGVSCGVPYAASIDVDRFLASLTWVTQAGQYQLAVTPKGISAAETILIARYQLFAEVYWHKTCRALVAMFKEAVRLIDAGAKFTQAEFDEVAISGGDNVMLAWLHDRLSTIDNEAATDLIGALIPGRTRLPYKRIATYSFTWARENTRLMYNEIGHANLTRLIEFRNYVLQNLNDEGQTMSPATWSNLKPHHLLIDIPPQHKAQLGELSVRYPDRVPGSERVKISEVSHLLHSLDDAVRLKVHRIRIFVHPSMRDQVTQVVGADARGFFDKVIPRFFSR